MPLKNSANCFCILVAFQKLTKLFLCLIASQQLTKLFLYLESQKLTKSFLVLASEKLTILFLVSCPSEAYQTLYVLPQKLTKLFGVLSLRNSSNKFWIPSLKNSPNSFCILSLRNSILAASPWTSRTLAGELWDISCMIPLASAWALKDMYWTDRRTSSCNRHMDTEQYDLNRWRHYTLFQLQQGCHSHTY